MSVRRSFLWSSIAAPVLLAGALFRIGEAQHSSWQVPPPQRLYVVFLPGMCGPSSSDCAARTDAAQRGQATFHTLIAALARAGVSYLPLYYSYRPGQPRFYSPADTQQDISRSVLALDRRLRSVRQHDPQAIFDLAGYSLGGVVAANWVATLARPRPSVPGMLGYLHSVVTLDAPLRGIRTTGYGLVTQFFTGAVWNSLQPGSAAIRAILSLSDTWWQARGHLHTVANTADRVVPPTEALLGDARIVTDTSCDDKVLWISLCHGAVMNDVPLGRFVACNWITTVNQCKATPTPTVTSSLSPSPTASATVTPSPTTAPPPPPPPPPRSP